MVTVTLTLLEAPDYRRQYRAISAFENDADVSASVTPLIVVQVTPCETVTFRRDAWTWAREAD